MLLYSDFEDLFSEGKMIEMIKPYLMPARLLILMARMITQICKNNQQNKESKAAANPKR